MAKKGPRQTVKLKSTAKNKKGEATGTVYYTQRNTRNTPEKLKLVKFDNHPDVRQHVEFVEDKMK